MGIPRICDGPFEVLLDGWVNDVLDGTFAVEFRIVITNAQILQIRKLGSVREVVHLLRYIALTVFAPATDSEGEAVI